METIKFLPYFPVTDRASSSALQYGVSFHTAKTRHSTGTEKLPFLLHHKHMISAINSWESFHLNKYWRKTYFKKLLS